MTCKFLKLGDYIQSMGAYAKVGNGGGLILETGDCLLSDASLHILRAEDVYERWASLDHKRHSTSSERSLLIRWTKEAPENIRQAIEMRMTYPDVEASDLAMNLGMTPDNFYKALASGVKYLKWRSLGLQRASKLPEDLATHLCKNLPGGPQRAAWVAEAISLLLRHGVRGRVACEKLKVDKTSYSKHFRAAMKFLGYEDMITGPYLYTGIDMSTKSTEET